MFYHIYLAYKENQETKIIYKTSVTNMTTVQLTDVPNDILYIPIILASTVSTPEDTEEVLTNPNIIVADAVINMTKPNINYTNIEETNTIELTSDIPNTTFMYKYDNTSYITLNGNSLNSYLINYLYDNISVIGVITKHINETFEELGITIDKTFYSHKSDILTIPLQYELASENYYTLEQVDLKKWEIINISDTIIHITCDDETILLNPNLHYILSEGKYTITIYNGVTSYSKNVVLRNNVLDLSTEKVQNIQITKISDTEAIITWEQMLYAEEYEIEYENKILGTTTDTQYTFTFNKNLMSHTLNIVAKNIFTTSKNSYKVFYSLPKPQAPIININGVNDVTISFTTPMECSSVYCLVYGVTYPDRQYEYIGYTHNFKFNLTKEHIDNYTEFVYRYEIYGSFSEYSDVFNFKHPTIFNRSITIEYLNLLDNNLLDCLIKWDLDPLAQQYAIFKNGLYIDSLTDKESSFRLPVLLGDVICVHSYFGLREAESNIIRVGQTPFDTDSSSEFFMFGDIDGNFGVPFI